MMHLISLFLFLSLTLTPGCSFVCQVVGSDGVRAMMESALTARDRVGVQDFVLLENYNSEVAFIDNLRKRFKENLIYVRIPSVFILTKLCFKYKHAYHSFSFLTRRTLARCWCQ